MGFRLEVKYYNTFWLKQITTPLLRTDKDSSTDTSNFLPTYVSLFPGIPYLNYTDDGYPNFPQSVNPAGEYIDPPKSNVFEIPNSSFLSNKGSNWVIEESRIRGGFNNTQVDLGVRAYLMEESNSVRYRKNALIYSGVFNSRTDINQTNVFSVAEDITKGVDPHNGSVQLIYAMDNNLTIFQENKVSTALIDKDAIYSAEGTPINTVSNVVIGQVTPYTGEYGISRNPESFASFGFRRYFADKDRSAILRLSRDGITEISQYGMKDFFRDELAKLKDKQQLFSEEFSLEYNITAGSITQGPQVPGGIPTPPGFAAQRVPDPLGPWFVVDSGRIAIVGAPNLLENIVIGSIVYLNIDTTSGGSWINTGAIVTGIGSVKVKSSVSGNLITKRCVFTDVGPLSIPVTPNNAKIPKVKFAYFEKDKIEGGFDNYKDNYIISMQQHSGSKTLDNTSDYYSTLTFKESVQGWTTFYTFRPDFIFSLKNNFFTTKDDGLYLHYSPSVSANEFYGVDYKSSITFVFNPNPSINKNFKTINYEGSNGWQVDSFISDEATVLPNVNQSLDETNTVRSYDEGSYIQNGITYRAGFTKKENKYYANLINNTLVTPGEVVFGASMTGIKGYFATVKMSTDDTTSPGGVKELFAASSEFVVSSQ